MRLGAVLLLLAAAGAAPDPDFRNIAASSGLTAAFPNGGDSTKQFIIETTGSGVALFDYDNDGLTDLFIISGKGAPSRLYHNEGRGKFRDATRGSGLERDGWGQGACVADYDNDGFTDLFVTYWGQNVLYRNLGGKRFEDVTAASGLQLPAARYNTGCAFFDFDRDGHADLFVANYLEFDPKTTPKPGENPYCWYRDLPVNCGPRGLPFSANLLYRNLGNGRFGDVTAASGIGDTRQNYCLSAAAADYDGDGWPDLFVACDQTPSLLYINQRNGKFREEGLLRGAALNDDGKAMSGMGVAVADFDGDGLPDIFRSNFSDERETLYRNRGGAEFDDVTLPAGLAHNTRFVGWGCGFFDFDNDGWKDLLLVNGHVFPEVDRLKLDIRYRDRSILYRNLGGGKFADISESAGPGITERHAARGAAFGDLDNDGRIEVVINSQNEPPALLRDALPAKGNWLLIQLEGVRSNRSAIGARVTVTADARKQTAEVMSGGSYLSQNDLRLHFGLAGATKATIEISWPSGARQTIADAAVNRVLKIRESATPLKQ